MTRPRGWFVLAVTAAMAHRAAAHDGPVQLPPPTSPSEAWNVLRLAGANIDQLLPEHLPRDVSAQLANIAIALPTLKTGPRQQTLVEQLARNTLATLKANAANDPAATAEAWVKWKQTRGELAALFPAEVVNADVFLCPMHPAEQSLKADAECGRCGMAMVRRRLPASAVYQRPGEPTLKLTLSAKPLQVGERADVILQLARADGRPVAPEDLAVAHTKLIHLLINDASLSDYHHEHPVPTGVAGTWSFSFTPRRPGPYRVWADVVPVDSQVQEYDIADLSADTAPQPNGDRETRLSATVDGRTFKLNFENGGRPIHAGEAVAGTVTVADTDGRGFTRLEPVMGAFAHLVGFCEDGRGVVHIHPWGKSPAGPDDRAGPAFAFKLYTPSPGLLRLYCQVQIDGRQVFAPFTLSVLPPAPSATRPAGFP